VPIRILYVSATGVLGGAERSLLVLVQALDRTRFEPLAAVPPEGPLGARLRSLSVDVFPIPPLRPRRSAGPGRLALTASRWAAAAWTIAQEARRRRVGLIHSNNTAAHLAALPAAVLAHLPCLWHLRDLHRLGRLGPMLAQATHATLFVSEAVRRAADLPQSASRIASIVPNAIDAGAFARAARPGALRLELGIAPGTPLVLMVAHMVPWKRHDVFIRAIGLLRERHPGVAAAVAGADLFGEHPGYASSLRRLVGELGLDGKLHFIGHREDVPTLMADCDVLAVASDAEPFGRVALEAMAVGTPVVGMAAGGLSEVVADGKTGMVVPPGDPAALADALHAVLSRPSLRKAMGEAARRCVRDRFSAAEHGRRIGRVYEEVLGQWGRAVAE